MYDFSSSIIERLQPIRSDEVQIMQLVDILIGATAYANRIFPNDKNKSSAKTSVIDLIKRRSRYSLTKSTLYGDRKFNLLVWMPRGEC